MGKQSRRKSLAAAPGKAASPAPAANAQALLAQGKQRQHARDVAGAAGLYLAALQRWPDDAEANQLYGLAVLELGQYELGLASIRRSITLAPGEARFQHNLGRALLLGGRAADALAAFTAAVALRPGYAQAHAQRAALLEALQQPAAAAAAWRAAIDAEPAFALAHGGLARLLYAHDALPQAVRAFEAATALDSRLLVDGRIGYATCGDSGNDRATAAAARQAALAACSGSADAAALPAAVADRELAVIDDFLDDPLGYRKQALALPFADRSAGGVNYPGLQTSAQPCDTLMPRFAAALGHGIKWSWPDHGAFRASFADSRARSDIHVDDAAGRRTYAGVLYLSLPEHCRGGTSFWRHRASGWECAPSPEALRAHGQSSLDAFHRTLVGAGDERVGFDALKRTRSDWDRVLEMPMRFNRLVLYRADHYHAISEVFGHSLADCRLAQLFFFERLGEPSLV